MGYVPKEFVVHICRAHKARFALQRHGSPAAAPPVMKNIALYGFYCPGRSRSGGKGAAFHAGGFVSPRLFHAIRRNQGGKELLPGFQYRGSPVHAMENQFKGPQFRPGNPERDGQGKGPGTKVAYSTAVRDVERQSREQPYKPVHVPGEKKAEVRGQHGASAKVRVAAFTPGRSKKPGKFRHIPTQAAAEPGGHGKYGIGKRKQFFYQPAGLRAGRWK